MVHSKGGSFEESSFKESSFKDSSFKESSHVDGSCRKGSFWESSFIQSALISHRLLTYVQSMGIFKFIVCCCYKLLRTLLIRVRRHRTFESIQFCLTS